jgi:lipoprotein-releasing system ATP-binding protein
MNSDLIVSARDLWKSYNSSGSRIDILKGVSFDFYQKETIAIVGASGIGKSTLLHILGTLDRPDKGTFRFQGNDVFKLDNGQLSRFRNQSIGFVFQFHYLLSEFNALENTMIPALINGQTIPQARQAATEILSLVGLEHRLRHKVNTLSGGEQQRVALARALILRPSLLLADEPTGNLDKKTAEQMHALLLDINQELGMTMIVVTHNLTLAGYMQRRVTISDGQLAEYESPT